MSAARPAASIDKGRAFTQVLVNTFIANLTTNFLWFAMTFWIYLETRNVLATAFLGGSYMLLLAVLGVPFGGLVDRWRKERVMVAAQLITALAFALALALFLSSSCRATRSRRAGVAGPVGPRRPGARRRGGRERPRHRPVDHGHAARRRGRPRQGQRPGRCRQREDLRCDVRLQRARRRAPRQ